MVWIRGECCKCPQVWIQPQYATLTAIDTASGATLWWEDRTNGLNAIASFYCAVNSFGIVEAGDQTTGTTVPIHTALRVFDGERSPTADVITGTGLNTQVKWVGADPQNDLFALAMYGVGITTSQVFFVSSDGSVVYYKANVSTEFDNYFMALVDSTFYYREASTFAFSDLKTLDTSGNETTIASNVWFVRRVGNKVVYLSGTGYITVVVRDAAGNETEYQSTIDASTVTSAQIGVPGQSYFSVHVRTTSYTVWSFDSADVASGPIVTVTGLVVVNDSMAMETTGDVIIRENFRMRRYDTGGLAWSDTTTTLFGDSFRIYDFDQFEGDIVSVGRVGLSGDTYLARMQVDKTITWQVAAPQAGGGASAEEIVVDRDRNILLLPHERVDK